MSEEVNFRVHDHPSRPKGSELQNRTISFTNSFGCAVFDEVIENYDILKVFVF
jgi:hypothetical protein